MYKAILDTNYLASLIDERDVHHNKALSIEERLIELDAQFVYLDCVINELVNVVVKRFKERKKSHEISLFIEKIQKRCPEEAITWMYPKVESFYGRIINIVKKKNGNLNFHDALIICVANELDISNIVSFDKGFDGSGLKRIKDAEDIVG